MTLVEVLVASLLLAGMMALVGTILIRTMWTNHHILGLNESSNQSQTQLEAVALAVRNASEVKVEDGGNLLVVKRRSTLELDPDVAVCSGWYFNPATGDLHAAHDSADGPTSPRTAAALSSPSAAAHWPVMIEGVGAMNGAPVFTSSGRGVEIAIQVETTRDRKPVEFRTEAVMRAKSNLGGGCG